PRVPDGRDVVRSHHHPVERCRRPADPPRRSGHLEGLYQARRGAAMKQQQGFTLIEVLVALVVAVAAMTLLSQGFSTGARASTTAQYATRAAILGQRVITDLETGTLSADTNQSGSFEDDADFSFETRSEATDLTGLNKVTI